ncbi:MAG: cysteine desulfurase, partial [Desulfobacula sp.]|nr:cysteine desulfurase [Desulfobacula sp.]
SSYEHPAILKTLDYLESNDISVSRIKPDANGIVTCEAVEAAIKENTRLVSIMFVNNEVGTINPVERISRCCRDSNILFHTDAVQAFGKIPIDMAELPVDLLSMSAHKLYGPKGVGALFIRNGTGINPILFGGGQEKNLRPGTENIPGIAAFGLAAELSQQNLTDTAHQIKNLTDQFLDLLKKSGLDFSQNGKITIPGVLNLTFPNVDAQTLVMSLDMAGVAVSAGSACSAGTVKVSGTLIEMGLNRKAAASSIRISFGKYHTIEDIEFVAGKICDIISKRQGING